MNAIPRHERFLLEDNEKQIEVTEDSKIPNAATIKVVKQDHTLANLLRSQLLSHPSVLFAGYKIPHPLQPHFLLKIQTDGTITPQTALEEAATTLIGKIASLEQKFKREFAYREVEGGGPAGGAGGNGPSAGAGVYGVDGSGAWTGGNPYMDLEY